MKDIRKVAVDMNDHYTQRCNNIQKHLDETTSFADKHRTHYDEFHKDSHYPDGIEKKMVEYYRQFILRGSDEDEEEAEDSEDLTEAEKKAR